jgi:hypothetical protein
MAVAVRVLPTLEELRKYVHETLCEHDALEPAEAALLQSLMTRRGRVCGLFFQVSGPRSVKLFAVWPGEENRILFYDSTGVRYAETRLSDAPDPASAAEELPAKKAA